MTSLFEGVFLAATLASLGVGIFIYILNPRRLINRLFLAVLSIAALWFFCPFMVRSHAYDSSAFSQQKIVFWLRLGSATIAWLPWLMQMMVVTLAEPQCQPKQIMKRSWGLVLCAICLSFLAFSESFIPSDSIPADPQRGPGYSIYFGILLTTSLVLLVRACRQLRKLSGARKIEMQIFVINIGSAGILVLVANYSGRLLGVPMFSRSGPLIFACAYGFTFWAITHHRLFDARQLVTHAAQRTTVLGIAAASAIAAVKLLPATIDSPLDALPPSITAAVAVLLCERPTRRLFGLNEEHRLKELRRTVVGWSHRVSDTEQLKTIFEDFLKGCCTSERVALLTRNKKSFTRDDLFVPNDWQGFAAVCKEGWVTPELLLRRRANDVSQLCLEFMSKHKIGALLAVPLGTDRPTLVLALGIKHNLRPYTYPDLRILLNLAELMDSILTHATVSIHAARISQMESATMISRSLAHDLTNLTTPVATYLLHAEGRAPPGSAEEEVYEAALCSVKIMKEYTRESIFFSQQLVPQYSSFNAGESIRFIARLVQSRGSARGIVVETKSRSDETLIADHSLFQRLLMNLLINAIDASRPETVVLAYVHRGSGQAISISVVDEGLGIPTENISRIFDPYFTTKNTGDEARGLGLGLAICRKIMELHGGTIMVISSPGRGSTFTATFPCSTEIKAPPAPGTAVPVPATGLVPRYQQASLHVR